MVRVCVGREVVRVCREGDWEGVSGGGVAEMVYVFIALTLKVYT